MKGLNIGENLIRKRKEKGITQEELARFIGVSKASVSKWETGHSYPDVVFLPQLAAYFNISLDDLIGYEPQMTDGDIRGLYAELLREFAAKPFEVVAERCRALAKKYYSCFHLLFQIATLLANYGNALEDRAQRAAALWESKRIFARVKEQGGSGELRRLALLAEASCGMLLESPGDVVTLLENEGRTATQPSVGALLAQAHQLLGNNREAAMVMQDSISSDVVVLFHDCVSFLPLCAADGEAFEETCKRVLALNDSFHVDAFYPAPVLMFYVAAAEGYIALDKTGKAVAMLESYAALAASDIYPLKVRPDGFFTMLGEIYERQLADNPFVMPGLPHDDGAIKRDIVRGVTENPAFSSLANTPRFKMLSDRLKTIL